MSEVNVIVIYLPTEPQGVHKNSFRNVRAFQDWIGIWKCWFLRRGENRSTRRKTSRSRVENKQQTQPTYDARLNRNTALNQSVHIFALDYFLMYSECHLCSLSDSCSGIGSLVDLEDNSINFNCQKVKPFNLSFFTFFNT